jgi:hypothetical protein
MTNGGDDGRPPHDGADETVGPGPDQEPGDDTDTVDGEGGFDAWRRRSAAGEVGTAIARGLGAVFAPSENTPVVSAPVPGDPPDPDRGFRVLLDPDDPSKAIAVFGPTEEDRGGSEGPPGD